MNNTTSTKPKFNHPLSTHEGRIERAIWTLCDGEKRGIQVAVVIDFLKKKGCTDDEVAEALNAASGGALLS